MRQEPAVHLGVLELHDLLHVGGLGGRGGVPTVRRTDPLALDDVVAASDALVGDLVVLALD